MRARVAGDSSGPPCPVPGSQGAEEVRVQRATNPEVADRVGSGLDGIKQRGEVALQAGQVHGLPGIDKPDAGGLNPVPAIDGYLVTLG